MSSIVHAEIPEQLLRLAQRMVDRGWALSVEALVAESLRCYLESHPEALTEQDIRNDLDWGLHGDD